jgi:hypothetical protein
MYRKWTYFTVSWCLFCCTSLSLVGTNIRAYYGISRLQICNVFIIQAPACTSHSFYLEKGQLRAKSSLKDQYKKLFTTVIYCMPQKARMFQKEGVIYYKNIMTKFILYIFMLAKYLLARLETFHYIVELLWASVW